MIVAGFSLPVMPVGWTLRARSKSLRSAPLFGTFLAIGGTPFRRRALPRQARRRRASSVTAFAPERARGHARGMPTLPRFETLASLPDDAIDVTQGALCIARDLRGGLDVDD